MKDKGGKWFHIKGEYRYLTSECDSGLDLVQEKMILKDIIRTIGNSEYDLWTT